MADIIEFTTTWPQHHSHSFYKVTSGGLCFDVNAVHGHAVIGLAKDVLNNNQRDYTIMLGEENNSWIRDEQTESVTTVSTPHILSHNAYRGFWLSWYGGTINIGRIGEADPFLSCPCNKQLSYVTFGLIERRYEHFQGHINWRIELPLRINKPISKTLSKGELTWVPMTGQLPDDCVIGGYEDEVLYIIRFKFNRTLSPGKYIPSEGVGYIPNGTVWSTENIKPKLVEILCGYNFAWVPAHDNLVPSNAIEGGRRRQESLYVGRAFHDGHLIPGMVQPSEGVCFVPYRQQEVPKTEYEVLVAVDEDKCRAEKLFNAALTALMI